MIPINGRFQLGLIRQTTAPDGTKRWFRNGLLHRDDGPAFISSCGGQEWWINGKRHRADGPAVIRTNGIQKWYLNGLRHRDDGPAVIHPDGSQQWFINGIPVLNPSRNQPEGRNYDPS